MVFRLHRGPGGAWFWYDGLATWHVRPGAEEVIVYPEARAVALTLVGRVMTFVLHQRGLPSLHASAATTPAGAVVFLGPRGRGKSTIASSFLGDGAALLTDDVLPLRVRHDGIHAGPGLPMMKLWPPTAAATLALASDLPSLTPTHPKRVLTLDEAFRFAPAPARIAAIYVLDRFEPSASRAPTPRIRRLLGHQRLPTLLAQTAINSYLSPRELAELLSSRRAWPGSARSSPSAAKRRRAGAGRTERGG